MADLLSTSVIIPAFNCERYLGEAIESALAQTRPPSEIILVDDGSTDGTAAVARRFGDAITVLQQPNGGIGAARNLGIARSNGAFLAFLDADDIWETHKLELQWAAFDADPSMDLCFSKIQPFLSPDLDQRTRATLVCPQEPVPGYVASSMLARRESFARVGEFGTEWKVGEFVDWLARAKELGLRTQMLDDVLVRRRIHCTNTVIRERASYTDYARIIRASLERRRKKA